MGLTGPGRSNGCVAQNHSTTDIPKSATVMLTSRRRHVRRWTVTPRSASRCRDMVRFQTLEQIGDLDL